ncbi:T9SS type A sorting domain-containing protein [Pedobacter arcticus]|uniref:T9SS type A sorting domain-containing protein n=1 Tax=Pedobacter arcticus TaxID=752140 RepID=UPI0002D53EA6|nr:T9SS type A sorting domain-containing protein [Pedobacter arcticus]
MKRILLFASFWLSFSFLYGQGIWTKASNNWTYDLGTNTGTGLLGDSGYTTDAINTTTSPSVRGFMPYPPSGSVSLVNVGSGTGKWYLLGTASAPKLRYVSSSAGKVSKLSAYNIENATSVASFFCKMEFNVNSATALDWRLAIGKGTTHIRNTAGLPAATSVTSFPTIFSTVRWNLLTAGTNLNFTYTLKTSNDATVVIEVPITGITFSKGSIYDMEFYYNNSSIVQDYIRDSVTYSIPAHYYHIWANGIRLSDAVSHDFPGMQLGENQTLDGIAFQGATSTPAGSSELLLGNLSINHVESPLGFDEEEVTPADSILPIVVLDSARVSVISAMIPLLPKGMGEPYHERTTWNALLASGKFQTLINEANLALTQPLPAITDSIYLAYWTEGDSQTAKTIMAKRRYVLAALVFAECFYNDGTYIPAINQAINDIIGQKSWNFPSEDRSKHNFNGTRYTIALCAADYAQTLGQTYYLLDDKLDTLMRQKIKNALYTRIFNPTMSAINTANAYGEFGDLKSAGNHNPVCISGVVSAALAVIPAPIERAAYVAIGERYSNNGVAGFLNDGYCTEGLSYYNYGFGRYIILREQLLQATSGHVDLFDSPKIRKIAEYAPNSEIINNVYPTIADCTIGTGPSSSLLYYVNKNLGMGLKRYDSYTFTGNTSTQLVDIMWGFPNSASLIPDTVALSSQIGIRSYFNVAGVLTSRPAANTTLNLAAVFKGGNNDEEHNHNDVGSFSVVSGSEMMIGDPGAIPYTAKTFNSERYTYKTINSYGHPVPVVAGKLQTTSAFAKAVVLDTVFATAEDKLVMDIKSAYMVPQLVKLERTFTYNRTDTGFVSVKDNFEFTSAQTFETALITRAVWQLIAPNCIELQGTKEKIYVYIAVPGAFTITPEVISEEGGLPYTRLGIALNIPILAGEITLTFRKPGFIAGIPGNWLRPTTQWNYNSGTNSGDGILGGAPFTQGTIVNTTTFGGVKGFMPYPESGSVRLGGITDGAGKGKWWLTGTNEWSAIRFASSNSGKVAKLAMYDIDVATAIAKISYKLTFNDSTTTDANWQFAIGKTAGTTLAANQINGTSGITGSGTASRPEIFAAFRWLMASAVYTFSFRDKANASATTTFIDINSGFFKKGGTYNMEFYCNNSSASEKYIKGATEYAVPARSYHIWVNDEQLTYIGSTNFLANELPADEVIDGFVFTSQTSKTGNSNNISAEMRLSNLQFDAAQDTPVFLFKNFSIIREDEKVSLKWEATSGKHDDAYEILRAENASAGFHPIGEIDAVAGTSESSQYIFTDKYPFNGANYYKVRQKDADGIYTESEVLSIKMSDYKDFFVFMDATELLNAMVFSQSEGTATLRITDVSGKILLDRNYTLITGYNQFNVDSSSIPKGVYVATLLKDNKQTSIKFIK